MKLWITGLVVLSLAGCATPAPEPAHPSTEFCLRLAEGVNEYEDFVRSALDGRQNAQQFADQIAFINDLRSVAPVDLDPQLDAYAAAAESMADEYRDGSTPTIDAPGWFGVSDSLRTYCTDVLSG